MPVTSTKKTGVKKAVKKKVVKKTTVKKTVAPKVVKPKIVIKKTTKRVVKKTVPSKEKTSTKLREQYQYGTDLSIGENLYNKLFELAKEVISKTKAPETNRKIG